MRSNSWYRSGRRVGHSSVDEEEPGIFDAADAVLERLARCVQTPEYSVSGSGCLAPIGHQLATFLVTNVADDLGERGGQARWVKPSPGRPREILGVVRGRGLRGGEERSATPAGCRTACSMQRLEIQRAVSPVRHPCLEPRVESARGLVRVSSLDAKLREVIDCDARVNDEQLLVPVRELESSRPQQHFDHAPLLG